MVPSMPVGSIKSKSTSRWFNVKLFPQTTSQACRRSKKDCSASNAISRPSPSPLNGDLRVTTSTRCSKKWRHPPETTPQPPDIEIRDRTYETAYLASHTPRPKARLSLVAAFSGPRRFVRSEEHTSELQSP